MIPLGLLFMMCFHYLLGIFSFKFLSINSFLYIAGNITVFLTGGLVPLALLPSSVQFIMKLFPFYYVSYLPAMLLTGHLGGEALGGILILALWVSAFIILGHIAYNRLRIRYEGVGI